jgi:hypothetical protein
MRSAGFFILALFLAGCTPELPSAGPVDVYVAADYFHSGILVHRALAGGTNRFDYYSFIEIDYYLNGDNGFSGTVKALLENMPSAVEIATYVGTDGLPQAVGSLFYAQWPDGWHFRLQESNVLAGLAYISNGIIGGKGETVGGFNYGIFQYSFYRSEATWSFLYNCCNFSADVLSHMGLPIAAGFYTYSADFLRMKLDSLTPMIAFPTND